MQEEKKGWGILSNVVKGVIESAVNPAALLDTASKIVNDITDIAYLDDEADIAKERIRIQCHKELDLQGIDDVLIVDAEVRRLKDLLRQIPQLLVDRSIQQTAASQALGRFKQAITRGQLLLRKRNRLKARTEGDLLEQRWKDMSFRVFRNAALKNYRGLFDLAARYVVLAGRAYSYEFDRRSDGENILSGIFQERRLGSASGVSGGLQTVISRLDASVTVNNFNRPLESLGERTFSFRRNLLGIGVQDFPNDDLRFRSFLESQIVERVEDLAEIADLAQLSEARDFGPGIVIPFTTEIESRNFFGRGPELPFGNTNFSITRNAKIRSYAIRLDGVDSGVGIDPQQGTVFVYFLPVGESVLRENNNQPVIEKEPAVPWAVVDQFLPLPPQVLGTDAVKRSFNPWRTAAQSGGNFLNAIKRQRDSEAQIELGQPLRFNTLLAGRSAWNTRWLLAIPGSQWTSSTDPADVRFKLRQLIYGVQADPGQHVGITDIRLVIQAYSH